MTPETWKAVDNYIGSLFIPPDAGLDGAQRAAIEADLPPIAVSAAQGKLLQIIARMCRARRILEIGTLAGYSTIWLARALPADGRLISLEFDPKHASVAAGNMQRAGVADRVEIRVGRAIDSLPALEGGEPFDLVFVDADKPSTPDYVRWALKLTRRGSVIIVDNVVRNGGILDASGADADSKGMREAMALIGAEPRLTTTAIQTVGAKGYDGFAISFVS
ncbi:MAG TPA: O-methyltransferase [Vicinamibacterales bacterium]|nr:O-methyltransferase [Vicinamibacterales bacterium]